MVDRVNRGFWYESREEVLAFKFSGRITRELLEFLAISDDACWKIPDTPGAACARVRHGKFITFESGEYIVEDKGHFKVMGAAQFDAKYTMMAPQPVNRVPSNGLRRYGSSAFKMTEVPTLCAAAIKDDIGREYQCSRPRMLPHGLLCWQHERMREAGKWVHIPEVPR